MVYLTILDNSSKLALLVCLGTLAKLVVLAILE